MAERHADKPPPDSPDLVEAGARDQVLQAEPRTPAQALSERRSRTAKANTARLWADPAYRKRISAQFKARWADPEYRARASGNHRDNTVYGWRQRSTGLTVRRTKAEMREEFGLPADGLDSAVAGRIKSTRGWELVPKPRMPVGPRWIFP